MKASEEIKARNDKLTAELKKLKGVNDVNNAELSKLR